MESKGVIIKVLDAVSGTSKRTGNPWMAQSFLIEVSLGDHGQYKRKQLFEIFGEDRIKEVKLEVGKPVIVYFDLEASEYEGKWYNRTRAYSVKPDISQMGGAMTNQGQYARQPMQQRQPQNGFYQPVRQGYPQPAGFYQQQHYPPQQGYPQGDYPVQGQGNADDLPF